MHTPLDRDSNSATYLKRLGSPDTMNVSEPDRDPLLIGNIDASDPRHLRISSKEQK